MSKTRIALALVVFAFSACGSNPGTSPASPDIGVGPSNTDGGTADTGVDAGIDAGLDAGMDAGIDAGPDCAAHPCDCCTEGQRCVDNACCTPTCAGKECGDDGCGESCGDCLQLHVGDWTCNPDSHACECPAKTDLQLCQENGKTCGALTATDNCGAQRTVQCDLCVAPQVCLADQGLCQCPAPSVGDFCAALHKECGSVTGQDVCGTARTEQCGTCRHGDLCSANNVCELCINLSDAQFCGANAATCGSVQGNDNCGDARSVACGTCPPGSRCDASHQCEVCPVETDTHFCARVGKQCGLAAGLDECGLAKNADCGTCASDAYCSATNQCVLCSSETDAAFCARNYMQCGPLTANDLCGAPRTVGECGPCANGLFCMAGGCVACTTPETTLCTAAGKTCGTPTLLDATCGQERIVNCGACLGTDVCGDNSICHPPGPPSNDTCTSPELLNFNAQGVANVVADINLATTSSYSSGVGPCAGAGSGADLVYLLRLNATLNVQVVVTPHTAFEPVVYIRKNACSSTLAADELTCRDSGALRATAAFAVRELPAGDYWIWVDSAYGTGGMFNLTVSTSVPPAPPANDTCSAPLPLVFTSGTATVTGSNAAAVNDYNGSCATFNGADLVYQMDLATTSAVRVTVTADANTPTLLPGVIIRNSTCTSSAAGDEVACAGQTNGVASTRISALPAGTYYVIVDSTNNSFGDFTLQVQATPPLPGDVCLNAIPLLIDPVSGVGTTSGDTSAGSDDAASSCLAFSSGSDLVYQFTISGTTPKKLEAEVIPYASSLVPVVSLRTTCDQRSSELACEKATTSTSTRLTMSHLAPGSYYLWVDGNGAAANGAFALNVTLSDPPPPPANDSCARATAIPLNSYAIGTIAGTTISAADDLVGGCTSVSTPHSGGDVAYSLTLASPVSLRINVTRAATSQTFRPAIYLRSACSDANTQLACANEQNGTAIFTAFGLTAGTYYLIVDGLSGTEGDFNVTVTPNNDTCATALPLVLDPTGYTSVVGDTTGLVSDTGSYNCSGAGPDVVYSLTLATRKNVDFTLTPNFTGDSAVLHVRTTCGITNTEVYCKKSTSLTAPILFTLPGLVPGTTYYVWVDGAYGNGMGQGAFTLEVQARAPQPPSNDECRFAAPLNIDPVQPSTDTVVGTTADAAGDSSGSCRLGTPDPTGGDVVYAFSLQAPMKFQAALVPPAGSSLKPLMYLRTTCNLASSEVAMGCVYNATAGATTNMLIPVLAPGSYYLIVDSYGLVDNGSFGLTVTTSTPPPAPTNDRCRDAEALVWNGTTATATADTTFAQDDERGYCSVGMALLAGPDVVYKFTLGSAAQVTAVVSRDAANTTYTPAVTIRSSCAATDEVVCARTAGATGTATATVSLPAGTYYVVVDGVTNATIPTAGFGPFTLTLTQATYAANDGCANPGTITIDPLTGVGTVSDTIAGGSKSGDGSCIASTASDLVYTLTLPSDKTVQVSLANQSGSLLLYPNVYLRRACADPSSELNCSYQSNTTTPASFTLNRVPAGTYYVWVDSTSATYQGPFTLTVTTSTPAQAGPPNDDCSAPTPLVLNTANGGTQVVGDTTWAFNDYLGNCAPAASPYTGPEVVYSFTLTQAATVMAAVARHPSAPSTFLPVLYLRTSCADPLTELACTNTGANAAASITQLLQPGTYYLFVDGQKASGGKFVLNVTSTPTTTMTNDGCTNPQPLTFDANGLAVAAGTNLNMANDSNGSCYASSTAPDVVYSFTLADTRVVTIDLNPAAVNMYPLVYVQTTCGSAATEKGCAYAYSFSGAEIYLGRTAPGTYYVFADAASNAYVGPFVLSVRAEPPPPPPANDQCINATPLTIDAITNKVTISADTQNGSDDDVSFCSVAGSLLSGPDLVYSFTLSTAASVTAKVTRDTTNTAYKPAVSIRGSCAPSDEVACSRDTSGVASATATLTAGTYYVFVDGVASATQGSTYGPFTLEISTATALLGDSCGSAIPLALDPITGIATATGTLSTATKSGDSSCNTSNGNDMVYSLTLANDSAVTVTLANPSGSNLLYPNVYMRRVCADPASESACAYNMSSAPATIAVNRVSAGTHFIWVDAYSTTYQGPFVLTVQTSAPQQTPPVNDVCRFAQTITLDSVSNAAHVTGDTTWATNDYAGTCITSSTYPMSGPDLVYTVTLSQAATLFAVVNKDPTETKAFYPTLYLRSASACTSGAVPDELACGSTAGYQTASFSKALPAGTYSLIVDGLRGSFGRFLLDVVVRASATMTGDSCTSPTPITLDSNGWAVVAGSTAGMVNDTVGGCTATSNSPDAVYSLTTTGPKNIFIDMMPGIGYYPYVYVRSNCTDTISQVGCDYKTTYGVPIHLDLLRKPAGTYYIFVDGYQVNSGLFSLQVQAIDPPPAPGYDVCSAAQAITLPAPGAAPLHIADTLLNSANNYTGACATASNLFDGADNVYVFTVSSQVMVSAKLTPVSMGLKPALYIRSTCDTVGGDKCAYSSTAGPSNPVTVNATLAAGTYYLIVDGVSGTTGDYTLDIADANYTGVGLTYSQFVTFATAPTAPYGMTVDGTDVIWNSSGSSLSGVPKTGGTVYTKGTADGMTAQVLGYDVQEANGSVFSLDTATDNSVGRLWKIKDATGGWLNPAIRWDVPTGVTTSTWPTSSLYTFTFDGTDLIIAAGGTNSGMPVAFYAVSPTQPGLPRLLGTASTVYFARGIAADANYIYVMGLSIVSPSNASLWRFDKTNIAAPPLEIFRGIGYASTYTAMRLDSLTAPQNLYVRPYAYGSAIHVVINPARATPLYMGPLGLPGIGTSNYNYAMGFDRATNTMYYFENVTAATGVIWKVQ